MTTPSNVTALPFESDDRGQPAAVPTRPLYWSIRRELWENRSIYMAPLVVALVTLFGSGLSTIGMPARRRAVLLLDPARQRAAIARPYDLIAMILLATAFLVGIFYCIDALYGERRDRSILFWKSLPVSDRTTVLAKASIPLLILPAITFAAIVFTQFLMLIISTLVLLPSGLAGTTWTHFHLIRQSSVLLYGFVVIALWHAPIYGWLLMISAWAKRAVFLWAFLPFALIGIVDKVAFNSNRFGKFLQYRLGGGFGRAFQFPPRGAVPNLPPLTPLRFLSTPGLWGGLLFTALFLAVAIRLRRNREPI